MQTAPRSMLESPRSVQTFLNARADKLHGVVKIGARMAAIARIVRADVPATVELRPSKMRRGKPTVENWRLWPLV